MITIKQRAEFFQHIAEMHKNGFSLQQSLQMMQEECLEVKLKMFYQRVMEKLSQGFLLVEALGEEAGFSGTVLMAVRSAEKTGRLGEILEQLALSDEKLLYLQEQLKTALMYPVFVLLVLIGVFLYMLLVVFPSLTQFLPDTFQTNIVTKFILWMATALGSYGSLLILALGLSLCFLLAMKVFSSSVFEAQMREMVDQLPVMGRLKKEMTLSVSFFVLAVLKQSGVSLDQAIRVLLDDAQGHFKKAFEQCLSSLSGGMTFSQALREEKYFPSFIASMLGLAEKSGQQDFYLYKVQEMLQRSLMRSLKVIVDMTQPVLLLLCAGLIVLIILGFLAPFYHNLIGLSMGGS